MSIVVPSEGEKIEKSLGLLIRAQFTDTDFFSVVGHTEIPNKVIHSLVMLMTDQRIMEVLSTPDPGDLEDWGDTELASEEYEKELDKFRLRKLIENDPKGMQAAILYGFNYYYALCMRSKDRRGRMEGVRMAAGAGVRDTEESPGLTSKLAHALGLGRLTKYERVYVNRE